MGVKCFGSAAAGLTDFWETGLIFIGIKVIATAVAFSHVKCIFPGVLGEAGLVVVIRGMVFPSENTGVPEPPQTVCWHGEVSADPGCNAALTPGLPICCQLAGLATSSAEEWAGRGQWGGPDHSLLLVLPLSRKTQGSNSDILGYFQRPKCPGTA